MHIRKCDRCGAEITEKQDQNTKVHGPSVSSLPDHVDFPDNIDLCKDCLIDLHEFIKGKGIVARNALKIQLDDGAFMPERAHPEDAGLDLFTPRKEFLPALRSVTIDTGVHIQLPEGTAGVLMSKSGLNANHGITSTGLIDEGYTGTIKVKLYNHSAINYEFQPGDKISQLVIVPVQRPVPVQVDEITGGARGADGFGSTGK